MCPHCGENAPLVYRGVVPYCTACGGLRGPLTNRSVNMAGKPSSVGGTVASVFGWLVLMGGLGVALLVGSILALVHLPIVALAVGGPIALVALLVGGGLVAGGKQLRARGATEQTGTRVDAIFALAHARGGILSAKDAADALSIPEADADALLTTLAKADSDRCSLEVDDDGRIFYRFANAPWMSEDRFRVTVKQRVEPGATGEIVDAELIDPAPRAAPLSSQQRK